MDWMSIRGEKDSMSERYWKNEWQYQRILEILDDYWITQKDEILVNVEMQFFNKDGQFQRKCISWRPKEADSNETYEAKPIEEMEIEEKEKVENIVWFNKDRSGWTQKKCDMTISKVKDGINVIIRNSLGEEVTSTGYIRIGFAEKDKNRMYFMAADKAHGWKMSLQPNSTTSHRTHIGDEKVIEGMLRFIGDYDLEISEDNLFYVDRRNVL